MPPVLWVGQGWLRPGDIAARVMVNGTETPLRFDGDDGTLWEFSLGSERFTWDHSAGHFAFGTNRDRFSDDLREIVCDLGGDGCLSNALSDEETLILDVVASNLHSARTISGRKLRQVACPPRGRLSGSEFRRLVDRLKQRHLVELGSPPSEQFRPTLPGLIASSEGRAATKVIETALKVLGAKFVTNPDVDSYSLQEVADAGGYGAADLLYIENVILIAALTPLVLQSSEESAPAIWGVPQDIEELSACTSLQELWGVTRAGRLVERLWPTVPKRREPLPPAPATIGPAGQAPMPARHPVEPVVTDTTAARPLAAATGALADYLPPALAGRFEVLQHLGTGSFAAVYQVVDRESLQRFALKVVAHTPDARERAHREVAAVTALQHRNIMDVLEHHPQGHWLLLPLAEGTLGQLHAWGRKIAAGPGAVAVSVGNALVCAHAAGFLHRDLHPDNILRHDGEWKVADWGMAVARDHQRLTRTRSVGGTVTWTAPEQLRSLKDADERSDLFSLGRIVEWLASGKVPDPTRPGALPREDPLAAFVNASTMLNRDDRPGTVQEALGLLSYRDAHAVVDAATSPPRTEVPSRLDAATRGRAVDGSAEARGSVPARAEVQLTLDYKKIRITQDHHDYELVVVLKNVARRRLDDWEVEIEFPTALLGGTVHGIKVPERSSETVTFFRVDGRKLNKPLRPGDEQPVKIGYFVNDDIYENREELFTETAKARALVDGEIAAEVERSISELQNF